MKSDINQLVVSSYNDWDPLEEIVVGTLDGCVTPPLEIGELATMHQEMLSCLDEHFVRSTLRLSGKPRNLRPDFHSAKRCLDEFVHILQAEGVVVRRPAPLNHTRPFSTMDWTSICGTGQTAPRDVMIVIGDQILESTMTFRSRYWEINAYRGLIKDYFKQGAKWIAPPKPQLTDELYNYAYQRGTEFVLTEFEPVFEVADIVRLGKDILVQRSNVTNDFGIEWLRRQLEPEYRVHRIEFWDYRAHHVDATFVPLAPGKVLIAPDRPIKSLPPMFKQAGWEFLPCPPTTMPNPVWAGPKRLTSGIWIHMNVLSLDEQRVIVDANEEPLINALAEWGFTPIPCNFRAFYPFGGGLHCATCDIRRRGDLRSYLD
jgi:glycine amidinotransferase